MKATTGVDIAKEARELLPPDVRADGFSNTAYNLGVDFKHIQAYSVLAGIIIERLDVPKFVKRFSNRRKFTDKYKLKFPLLSDADGKMLEKYDAWGEKNMYGKKSMGIIRSTVLIGPDGKVIKHWPKVKVKGHVDEVLEALDEARSR